MSKLRELFTTGPGCLFLVAMGFTVTVIVVPIVLFWPDNW